MTYEVIDRLVRPANPVPDPRMLEPVDVSVLQHERREEMQTQEPIQVDSVEVSSRRGWLLGAAAALVVVIGAVVLFQMTTNDSEVASQAPNEIANAYVAAYAAFDVEGVESMLAVDAEVLPWEAYEGRDWKADLRYLEAAGFELILGECRELPGGTDGVVNCEYDAHGLGSDQIGEGPFGGNAFELVITDGLVVSSDMGFNFSEFHGAMWSPFQTWIRENHPDDYAVLYVHEGLSRQTDEAIALWEQRVADYVEYVNNPTSTTTPG